MQEKKVVVIYANCMGSCIRSLLEKTHSNEFVIHYFANFEIINSKMKIPDEIALADIFLYQNYNERQDEYNLQNILETMLKPNCMKVCFPTLHSCHLLFGYDTSVGSLSKPEKDMPFGPFFFGIKNVFDILKAERNNFQNDTELINFIIQKSEEQGFISSEQVAYYKDRTFEFLRKKILNSDIPELYDFILNNYTKIRLWSNPNHPTNILINELVKNIFLKLHLPYNENENLIFFKNSLNDWEMPILPSVQNELGLEFDCKLCGSWYFPNIKDRKTYLETYLSYLIKN